MTMKTLKILSLTFFLILLGITAYYFYPEPKLTEGVKIDKLVVYKSKRQMLAYSKGELVKTYKISLGRNPIGHKQVQGDRKTPEGLYYINDKNPYSGYHKNLGISYPNKKDRQHAQKLGKSAGGDIKIHGLRNGDGYIGKFQRWTDWTLGCIALTNQEVDELYDAVIIGSPIEIHP